MFEGRDTAGKGGTIKRIIERVSPRVFRVVALPAPTEREKSQMYVQRYISHFPAAGEVAIFDRSWYNRAGVERVMGFCTPEQTQRFLELAPGVEKAMVESGIILIKYWLEVGPEEQARRLESRIDDPRKVWKLSDMDLKSYSRWYDYSRARDDMFKATDTAWAPWFIAHTDDKKRGRLNIISHLLSQVPYEPLPRRRSNSPSGRRPATTGTQAVAAAHPDAVLRAAIAVYLCPLCSEGSRQSRSPPDEGEYGGHSRRPCTDDRADRPPVMAARHPRRGGELAATGGPRPRLSCLVPFDARVLGGFHRLLRIAVALAAGAVVLTGCGGSDTTEITSVTTSAESAVDTSGTGTAADSGAATTERSESDDLLAQGVALEAVLAAVASGDEQAVRAAEDELVKTSTCPACPDHTQANLKEVIAVVEEKYPDLAAPLQQALDALPES